MNIKTTPNELGISDRYSVKISKQEPTREIKQVEQNEIIFDESNPKEGLKSTSAEIDDTWSLKGQAVHTEGGGSQIYIPKGQ